MTPEDPFGSFEVPPRPEQLQVEVCREESGAAVVLYSSDLDEVLALSTRILVLHAGQLRECALDRDAVGRAMLGVA